MGNAMTGVGAAVWLVPEEPARARLASWIERLSLRLGTRSFAPHVTLLSGLVAPEEEVLSATAALARTLPPLSIRLDGIEGTDAFFRCVYARAQPTEALLCAHARASRHLGGRVDPAFLPHLSLVYGTLAPAVKAGLVHELDEPTRLSFAARRLHVWRTVGEVEEWAELGVFDLGAPAA